ncbi:MAG TPA: Na+/H+ antiporter NhaA [Vicinamibacterales bacterium]|nr:Na+/H+ antiporter NhaA [Vicinamibacterales bacterium]
MRRPAIVEHHLLLPLGVIIAVVWANLGPVTYFSTAHALSFWVNDVGMAFVLAFLGQEVFEAALPGGTIHPWRRTIVPVIAAVGGMAGAVAFYAGYLRTSDEHMLAQGWPVACAVDVLLVLAVTRAIFHRSAATTFALLLAIAGDLIGLAIISGRYQTVHTYPIAGVLIVPAIAICVALRRGGVRALWPYVCFAGPLSWAACYSIGVHPAVALLPVVPFLPHAARDLDSDNRSNADARIAVHESPAHLEYAFRYPVEAIGFLFGLVNAGVLVRGFGAGTWAVLAASLVGRPAGIVAAVALAIAAGLPLPRQFGWRELIVVALAASPALTFGVFFATTVFPPGPLASEVTIGSLATVLGVVPAFVVARLLRVGRFGDATERAPRQEGQLSRGRA